MAVASARGKEGVPAAPTSIPFGDPLIEVQLDGKVLRPWPGRELQNWPRVRGSKPG